MSDIFFENNDKLDRLLDEFARVERLLDKDKAAKRLAMYNSGPKVHQKQMAFHKCPKRSRWVLGGNRSGKTECGAVETVWLARGVHPYRENKPVDAWVVSLSRSVQKAVAQKKILSFLPEAWIHEIVMSEGKKGEPDTGVIDSIVVDNVFGTTSTITFKSAEEGREKFQGASLDFVWFDEEPPEDVWRECCMRVLDKKGDIFATLTPLLGLTFVHNEIYLNPHNDPEIWVEFMSWADNPFLPAGEVERLEATMPEDELLARRDGKFVEKQRGLVYGEFDPSVHVIEPFPIPPEWQSNVSIDPGLNNPLSCHFYAVDEDGNIFVVAEHYARGETVDFHAERILEIANTLRWKRGMMGKLEALIDSAATQKTLASPKSVADLFFERGIAVNPKVDKDIFSGLNRVKHCLKGEDGKPHLFVFSCCHEMIREFKTYSWGAGENPIKRDDHAMDELRYFVASLPQNARPAEEKKSDVLKEKERLMRRNKRRFGR